MASNKSPVYETIRESILNLDLEPGSELDINALAKKLDVSRSPVRDALLKLSADKLVDIFPQKGTRVSLLNKEIIRQERFMRINLELGVIRECMKTLEDSMKREIFVTKMQGTLVAQRASLLDDDKINFLRLDDKLHHLFYAQANCEWVWETLLAHSGNDHRIRMLSYNASGIYEQVEKEHAAILSAIHANDVERIVSLDKNHLSRLYEQFDTLETNFPEFFEK